MAGNEEIIVDAEVWEPEQEDSFVLLSCKKCGKNVPAHYEFCPHCKKRLQKKKQKKNKACSGACYNTALIVHYCINAVRNYIS